MRRFIPLEKERLPLTYDAETLGGQPLVELRESEKLIEISYRFPGFFQTDIDHEVQGRKMRFNLLDIGGVGRLVQSGKPELPSFGRYVQIPSDSGYTLTVDTPGTMVQLDDMVVSPAQENMTDGATLHQFEYDASSYAKDEFYPKELVELSGPYVIDGYPALLVQVRPLQYNAKRKVLRAYPRIDVKIVLSSLAGAPSQMFDDAESREAYGNLFLNPRREVGPRVGFPPGPHPPLQLTGPQLLIVYAPQFRAAAEALALWKNQRGLVTELQEYSGTISTPAALKAAIRSRRAGILSRLRYVMLLGDWDDINGEDHPASGTGNHTDYYYSTREDCSASVPFPLPWLALGRIPVRDATEAMSVVQQIINYEKSPPTDPAYYHRFVCAAHFETVGAHDQRSYVFTIETIRAFLTSLGYDAERIYTCDTSTRPLFYQNGQQVPADVEAAIMAAATATQRLVDATTEGHSIIAHRDHGADSGWVMPPFTLAHLDQVTGTVPSLFYSLNCRTGAFDATSTTECFAEKVLRLPGTAPTLLASTENSSTALNNALMLALIDASYGGLLPTYPGSTLSYPIRFNRIGDMLNYARCYLPLVWSGSTAAILSHNEMYHVLGDPSLEVWTDEPKPVTISAKLLPHALEVELKPLPPNCVVTIYLGDRLLKRIVPTSARFAIPIPDGNGHPPVSVFRPVIGIYSWAPGFRFAGTHIRIPVVQPVPIGVA